MFTSTVMLGFSLKAEYAMHWQMGYYQQVSQYASTINMHAGTYWLKKGTDHNHAIILHQHILISSKIFSFSLINYISNVSSILSLIT
jgi:hypothetical protein